MLQKRREEDKIEEKERQQLLAGLGIWKLELKPELGRRAKTRTLILGRGASRGLLSGILDRLKRPR
jgi:hypothetical protein